MGRDDEGRDKTLYRHGAVMGGSDVGGRQGNDVGRGVQGSNGAAEDQALLWQGDVAYHVVASLNPDLKQFQLLLAHL